MPVNKLLPEFLSKVLGHQSSESDLVSATHACQYWRFTLISSPSLWNRVKVLSRRKLHRPFTYLERPKSAPTDVRVHLWLSKTRRTLKHLAFHIQRTRSLEIHGSPTNVPATSSCLHNSILSLQQLKFHSRKAGRFVCFPSGFFREQLSSLRSVTFDRIEAPPPFPNLMDFNLYLESMAPPRMSLLFQFLSYCPQIQKICVRVVGRPKNTPQEDAPNQIIPLETLVELEYACSTVIPAPGCHASNNSELFLPCR